MPIKEVVELFARIGLWDVVIPFCLVFTLVFAILERTKVLGKEKGRPKSRLNAVIAFVIGFFVIALTDVLKAINILSQYIVVLILAGLFIAVLLGFLGVKDLHKSNLLKVIALLLVFGGGLYAMGLLNWINSAAVNRWIANPVTGMIIFLFILYLIFQIKSKPRRDGHENGDDDTGPYGPPPPQRGTPPQRRAPPQTRT